jgi:hypothetical protein
VAAHASPGAAEPVPALRVASDGLDVPEADPAEDARRVVDDLRSVAEVDGELPRIAAADVQPVELQYSRSNCRRDSNVSTARSTRLLQRRFPMRRRAWFPSWSWKVPLPSNGTSASSRCGVGVPL